MKKLLLLSAFLFLSADCDYYTDEANESTQKLSKYIENNMIASACYEVNMTMYYFVNKEMECGDTDLDNEMLQKLGKIKDVCEGKIEKKGKSKNK